MIVRSDNFYQNYGNYVADTNDFTLEMILSKNHLSLSFQCSWRARLSNDIIQEIVESNLLRCEQKFIPRLKSWAFFLYFLVNYEILKKSVKRLLDKRSVTDMTYEDAYDFVFKSWGRDDFYRLAELIDWKESEIDEDLIQDIC